jgi:hypothetical protein
MYNILKFKGNHKGFVVFFTMEQIYGNKIGIPCVDVNNTPVSIHILDMKQYTGMDDVESNEIYDHDKVENDDMKGTIIFDSGAWCVRIDTKNKNYAMYDIGQSPALFEFNDLKIVK